MKISVHLEADSAEELQAFFAAFQTKQFEAISPLTTSSELSSQLESSTDPDSTKNLVQSQPAEEPVEKPVEKPAELQPVKAKRGRKPKLAQQEPKPEPTPAPPEEPQQTPPPKPVEPPVADGPTRADLSDTFNAYIRQYGHFGFNDVSALLQQTFGETVRKASDVTDDNLARAIHVVRQAVLDNPFNRKTAYAN